MCIKIDVNNQLLDIFDKIDRLNRTHNSTYVKENMMCLWAVHSILAREGIDTNFKSNIETYIQRQYLGEDSIEIEIPTIGKIICCNLDIQNQIQDIPVANLDRVAFVAIELDTRLTQATIYGFISVQRGIKIPLRQFSLNDLICINDLSDYLDELREINFNQNKSPGWRSFNEILSLYPILSDNPLSMVNSCSRGIQLPVTSLGKGKVIQLGVNIAPVTLNIRIDRVKDREDIDMRYIKLEIAPLISLNLPSGLSLILIDEDAEEFEKLEINGEPICSTEFSMFLGDRFSIILTLDQQSSAMQFLI